MAYFQSEKIKTVLNFLSGKVHLVDFSKMEEQKGDEKIVPFAPADMHDSWSLGYAQGGVPSPTV